MILCIYFQLYCNGGVPVPSCSWGVEAIMYLICGVPLRLCGFLGGGGLGPKPCPAPMPLWGFWLCKGVKDCPSLLRPLLPGFCSLFLAANYAKGVGKGRVGGGKQGGSLKDWGDWACKEGAIPVPLRPAPALSHGVLEKKGAGWPDWLARPWGQREGPRPARGAAQLHSPPSPSPPASPGRECLVPAAPSLGPEGRAGRAVSYPLLPTSSPPRCEPEPPPLPPLTHAAPGLAGRRVWDRVRGWGEPCGRAGATWWPCPARASAPGGRFQQAVFMHPNHPSW